jgi:hypothetical protein
MTPEDATWLKLVDVFLELFAPCLQCTSMYLSAAFTRLVYRNLGCDKNEMPFTSDEYGNLAYLYSLDGTGMEYNSRQKEGLLHRHVGSVVFAILEKVLVSGFLFPGSIPSPMTAHLKYQIV